MTSRFGMVLGVAAVATLAGCKDPDYVGRNGRAPQEEVKNIETAPAPAAATPAPAEIKVEPAPAPAPEPAPVVAPAPAPKPAEPAFTVYTVRRGDYLAKISKKYNVTISSIKRLNPKLKGDAVMIGQKLKLPGVIEIEAAPAEPAAPKSAAPKAAKKPAAEYTGATKEYVVKNGDTLGGVAYGHGINIRQLKKLNGLTGDKLMVGQKLKVPADGKPSVKAEAKPAPAKDAKAPAPALKTESAPIAAPAPAPAAAAPAQEPAEEPSEAASEAAERASEAAAAAPQAAPAVKTYVVQEGEDMAGVSVAWGVTASQIRELNNMGENDQLKPGQTIRLPAEADQQ